ncbi:MAG: hypothetical protein K6T83_18150, partial [Alicyclobacillus sp.]|nr:hypothetical protein [Alicyclobacillus sp.]
RRPQVPERHLSRTDRGEMCLRGAYRVRLAAASGRETLVGDGSRRDVSERRLSRQTRDRKCLRDAYRVL